MFKTALDCVLVDDRSEQIHGWKAGDVVLLLDNSIRATLTSVPALHLHCVLPAAEMSEKVKLNCPNGIIKLMIRCKSWNTLD